MQRHEQHAHQHGAEHLADGEEVAEGLRHLGAAHVEHVVVQPDAGEAAAGEVETMGWYVDVYRLDKRGNKSPCARKRLQHL